LTCAGAGFGTTTFRTPFEVYGLADNLEAAKAAFKTNWERLLAAGTVKSI
jgi:hypothetical protein